MGRVYVDPLTGRSRGTEPHRGMVGRPASPDSGVSGRQPSPAATIGVRTDLPDRQLLTMAEAAELLGIEGRPPRKNGRPFTRHRKPGRIVLRMLRAAEKAAGIPIIQRSGKGCYLVTCGSLKRFLPRFFDDSAELQRTWRAAMQRHDAQLDELREKLIELEASIFALTRSLELIKAHMRR